MEAIKVLIPVGSKNDMATMERVSAVLPGQDALPARTAEAVPQD